MELFNGVIGGIALYAWFRVWLPLGFACGRAAATPTDPPDDNTFATTFRTASTTQEHVKQVFDHCTYPLGAW